MKRINMVKYGFVRWPEEDFSTIENRFTCYRAGKNVRVSKLVADGEVYLSIASDCGKATLPYQIYSKLPHYNAANWEFNGVTVETLTDEDLYKFYEACVAYEKEYEEAETNFVYPTLEELTMKAQELYIATKADVVFINKLFNKYAFDAATKMAAFEWKTCQDYIKNLVAELDRLDPDTYPNTIFGTSYSFTFMERKYTESYYSTYIKDLFKKYCMF